MCSLAQSYLAGVVIHSSFGFCDQNRIALSYQRIVGRLERRRKRQPTTRAIWIIGEDGGNARRLGQGQLIAIAIVREMVAVLSVIAHTQRQLTGNRTLDGKVVLLNVGWLVILRPNRVSGVLNAERLTEGIRNRKRGAARCRRWAGGIRVDRLGKRRTGSQALIERIAFKEAGGAVAPANHGLRIQLVGKTQAWHDLLVIGVIAGVGGANRRARHRQSRDMACVFYGAVGQHVCGLVVLLIPGLIVLIAQSEIDREPGGHFKVVLKVARQTPLAIADIAERGRELGVEDAT